jgi:hypothetical protein
MIVDAPWYVPNTVIRRDLRIPTVKGEIPRYSSQYSARLSAHPVDLTVNLMELPDNKTPAKWSAYQIPSAIVVFVILVFKVYFVRLIPTSHKRPWTLLVTEERFWTLFYMPLYTCLHNLLNVLVQSANKMGLRKQIVLWLDYRSVAMQRLGKNVNNFRPIARRSIGTQ